MAGTETESPDEENVPTESTTQKKDARFPGTNAFERWTVGPFTTQAQGPSPPRGVKPKSQGERKRLKRREDFEHAYREGRRVVSPFFVAFVRETDVGSLRVGVVASRRVGGAVARNRAKRLLREAFRKSNPVAIVSADVVLVARRAIGEVSSAEVERACSRGLGHILERLARAENQFGRSV